MQRQFTFLSLAVLIGLAFVTTSVTNAISNSNSKSTMYAQARSGSDSGGMNQQSGSSGDMSREPRSDMDRSSDMDRQQRSGDMSREQRMGDMQRGDIFAMLRQEHQQVSQILSQLQGTTDPSRRNQMVKELNVALYPHIKAENETLYKALKDDKAKETKDMVKQAQKEHDEIERTLRDVNKSINENTFNTNVQKLTQLVTAHVQREENQVFAAARNLDQSKLTDVTNKYKEEQQKLAQKTYEKDYGKDRGAAGESAGERSTRGDRTGTSTGNVPGGGMGSGSGR